MLTRDEVRALLGVLCERLGVCLPPSEIDRLASDPPTSVVAFTDAVLRAEGLDPATCDRHLHRQVRDAVTRSFASAASESER